MQESYFLGMIIFLSSLFSFFGGRCRQCQIKISWRYPIVEATCALLFLALFLKMGLSYTLIEILIFTWAGLVASVIDLDHRILPDVFTLSGIVRVGLVGAAINPERSFVDAPHRNFLPVGVFCIWWPTCTWPLKIMKREWAAVILSLLRVIGAVMELAGGDFFYF